MSKVSLVLFFGETSLVAREDPPCRLVFTNQSDVPVDVPNLDVNPAAPEFVIQDLNGGDSRSFDPQTMWRDSGTRPLPVNPGDGAWTTLGPGQQVASEFWLSHRVRLPLPGGYGVSVWFRTGGDVVRSNTVKIVVAPAQVVGSSLVHSHGGTSRFWFEGWVARQATPLLFVRAARVGARFQQLQCLRVARLPDVVTPVISVAPNDRASGDRSVAWLHGGTFHVVDVGLEKITHPLRSTPVPGGGGFIVEPLWKDGDTGVAQGLVWNEIDRAASALSLVEARPDAVSVISTVQVSAPRPAWSRAFHDSKGGRRVLFLVDDGARSSLHGLVCAGGIDVFEKPFEAWPLRTLAVNAQMTREDAIVGAVVGRSVTESPGAPTLVFPWSIDSSGRFSAGAPRPWPALDTAAFDHLQMLVDVAGRPAVLVPAAEGGWSCVREDQSYEVTPPLGLTTNLPPTLALAPDGMTPMVVWHDAWRGLIPTPIGVEVPDFLGEDFVRPSMVPEGP
jgi:hypothetical protein